MVRLTLNKLMASKITGREPSSHWKITFPTTSVTFPSIVACIWDHSNHDSNGSPIVFLIHVFEQLMQYIKTS